MRQLLSILLLISTSALAKPAGPSSSKNALDPAVLGTKALLEDLLARRYAQGLGTIVDKAAFDVGAQLDLVVIPPAAPKAQPSAAPAAAPEGISDLLLGTLDPEELIKKVSEGQDEKVVAKNMLAGFRIKTVKVSVGLRDSLAPNAKAEVETWLKSRLATEFGAAGSGDVAMIQAPLQKPAPEKTLLDNLNTFQSLAGQIVLALALLIAVILWQSLAKPAPSSADGEHSVRISGGAGAQPTESPSQRAERQVREESERTQAIEDVNKLTENVRQLVPTVAKELSEVVRTWCQQGEEGKLRLAVFAEAAGREFGRLPIPADALADVTKTFAKMPAMAIGAKRDALQKAYWDLMSAVNLGTESLSQPFGYLAGVNVDLVNQMLIDQNPKMKTLVSLFMPENLRSDYVGGLSTEGKLELLRTAANLNEIPTRELREMDGAIAGKVNGRGSKDVVALDLTLDKVVSALSPVDEIVLLGQLDAAAVAQFRRVRPTLAFLPSWPVDKIARLLTNVTADELTAYLRVVPEQRERLLELAPTMTAEMVVEELDAPDRVSATERNRQLAAFATRLTRLVRSQEIRLEEVFPPVHNEDDAMATVTPIKVA